MDAQSPSAHTSGWLPWREPHGSIDHDVSALVLLNGEFGHDRIGDDAGCEDNGRCLDRFVRQDGRLARVDAPHLRIGPDVRPTPLAEHPGPIICKFGVDFRHDAVAALEHEKADLVAAEVFVKRRDPVRECGHLAEQFHPDQSAADDREGEEAAFALRVGFHVGTLEALDHVIAEEERVGQGLEREGVLRAENHRSVGHAPEPPGPAGRSSIRRFPGGGHVDQAGAPGRCPGPWPRRTAWSARRASRIGKEQRRMSRVPEQTSKSSSRRHQQEVVPAHQDNLDARVWRLAKPLQMAGGVNAAEAAAENHDPRLRHVRVSSGGRLLAAYVVCLVQRCYSYNREIVRTTVPVCTLFSQLVMSCPAAA